MKKLLSLPPNLVRKGHTRPTIFHEITGRSDKEFYCTSDPKGCSLGSGGGTAWLLWQSYLDEKKQTSYNGTFDEWLSKEKRILLHAGGQSRRLPAYAPSGKLLVPVPVFRWERGQRLDQDLLSLQQPLFEHIMESAPEGLNTMIVSGDVLIRSSQALPSIPKADVVCYGLWLDAAVASNHGVFISSYDTPHVLKKMLQKPSVNQLQKLQNTHYYLTDIGVWLLSDRAVRLLMNRSGITSPTEESPLTLKYYDLYSEFGATLGTDPCIVDPELNQLTVAVIPLNGGEFYHFGTSRDMISSMVAIQNIVSDQRQIMHHDRKPHPSIFVQNAITDIPFNEGNRNVWIENSHIGPHWQLTCDNIITGVPENDWHVTLYPGDCIDIVPIDDDRYALRYYYIGSKFEGGEQQMPLFPILRYDEIEYFINSRPKSNIAPQSTDGSHEYLSAEQLSDRANLFRLFEQRQAFRTKNWTQLAKNWEHSVFYQVDLEHAAKQYTDEQIPLPPPISEKAPVMTRIQDAMFRGDSEQAFGLLRQELTSPDKMIKQTPRLSIYPDQIVWARSPVRIDISGGWSDTPPFCLLEGGNVVNFAVDLNGQQPLQTYIKPSKELRIVIRSIDIGAEEVIESYDQLRHFNIVGSPFSIPKTALALTGFLPEYSAEIFPSLKSQLESFGGGFELTLLSAIPAGSGMGTSSILAATVLGALSNFCSLAWDKNEIGHRTLILEQLLTTGGGWQDQFGGICSGVKLLQTQPGFQQQPLIRWLPTDIYTQPDYHQCHLLYYTGITRTAKLILTEIVRRMFLNQHEELIMLRHIKERAIEMYECIQRNDFHQMGTLLRSNWEHNQKLDLGTNPDIIKHITSLVDDLCLGYKLPGAGGGGFLYMVAKDPDAAARIRHILTENTPNANARFVEMSLSTAGLQISRS